MTDGDLGSRCPRCGFAYALPAGNLCLDLSTSLSEGRVAHCSGVLEGRSDRGAADATVLLRRQIRSALTLLRNVEGRTDDEDDDARWARREAADADQAFTEGELAEIAAIVTPHAIARADGLTDGQLGVLR
jgi:hypothetical protein